MGLLDSLLGRRLASSEGEKERLGPLSGIATLGLDALGSIAYGPEAALVILIPLGISGLNYIQGILWVIVILLAILFFSYRQTIGAYPNGGGSYIVAKENLGTRPGLFAAASLLLDYILTVAVGISAGIGALESAFPALQEHTLEACLIVLLIITLVNLRGVREAGLFWITPTYLFVASLACIVIAGIWNTVFSGGHPIPIEKPPDIAAATTSLNSWLIIRAFASGCTAMTGVEAVSNAVPIFRKPSVENAQRTLLIICAILGVFLIGVGYLAKIYHIGAMDQQQPNYQSIISQLAGATLGHGFLYYVCIGSVLVALAISANTGFSDFPRLCRLLAEDGFLPRSFSNQGRRLVYTHGILVLALISASLLICFDGITDRLIPLYAIGAFGAFTFSQAGMVMYWRRMSGGKFRFSQVVNAVGAIATGAALVVIIIAKFTEGAWITLLLIGGLAALFSLIGWHYSWIETKIGNPGKLKGPIAGRPLFIVPILGWNRIAELAIRYSLQLSEEVIAVNVTNDEDSANELRLVWKGQVEEPAQQMGFRAPRLKIILSPFRLLFRPLLDFVQQMEKENPDRVIAVVIPELVEPKWWEYLLHNYSVSMLKARLLMDGGNRVIILNIPWHLREN